MTIQAPRLKVNCEALVIWWPSIGVVIRCDVSPKAKLLKDCEESGLYASAVKPLLGEVSPRIVIASTLY